jgi:hypothetical protein
VLCRRHNPAGPKYRARIEHKHGTGKALTVLAQTLARAVYDLWQRGTACTMDRVLQG